MPNDDHRFNGNLIIHEFYNTFRGVRNLSLLRPRYLAIAFGFYFGLVAYLAYQVARRTTSAWYTPAISQIVYQTTMVGGVLVLVGLFVTASILPHLIRPTNASGFTPNGQLRSTRPPSPYDDALLSRTPRTLRAPQDEWEGEDFLSASDIDTSRYQSPRQAEDAAAVSAALSRLLPSDRTPSAGTLMERLTGIRARNSPVFVSEGREMSEVLVRLVNEMKPLLVAAKRAGLNVPEIRRLVSEATAGRQGDLGHRVRLVEDMKATLEAALVERIAEELQTLLVDIERTKAETIQVHAAELTAAEGVALLDTGNYAAALDRAAKARETIRTQAAGIAQTRVEWIPTPITSLALVGPSIAAVAYVAIAAMLLPGVVGYLETQYILNTTVILFLSYAWFGLILYALSSIYVMSHPRSFQAIEDEMATRDR